jgi:hypothetical protein
MGEMRGVSGGAGRGLPLRVLWGIRAAHTRARGWRVQLQARACGLGRLRPAT